MPGRYRIFLGMAAGVGKTYRMLAEAQAEAEAGRDVVIGLLETHGARGDRSGRRRASRSCRAGASPTAASRWRRWTCRASSPARPELCLIDELAHTNAPGLEHPKRYEDIADVLAAGIDVFSTVNVQHLESLNDQVAELTGVRVRETVPDDELGRADEIVLVDLPPEDLIARLRAGKVYPAARIAPALNGFFRVENLRALREVALRQVAENVEERRLVALDRSRSPSGCWPSSASTSATSAWSAARGAPRSGSRASSTCSSWSAAAAVGAGARAAGGAAAADRDARRAPAGRGGGDEVEVLAPRRPRARHDVHPARPAEAVARVGRFSEPLVLRILRALPDVDVRVVAQR